MNQTDPNYNPFTPVNERGYVNNNPDFWAATLPKLQDTAAKGNDDPDVSTFIGWGLIYTYQTTAAKDLLGAVVEKAPDTIGADWGYFKALEELNRELEAIDFGRRAWVGKKNHGFCLLVSQSLLELSNVEQAKDLVDEWQFLTTQGDGVAWETLGHIAAASGDWPNATSCFAVLLNNRIIFPNMQLHFLRSLARSIEDPDVFKMENACAQVLKVPMNQTVWLRYQMGRWARCSDVAALFAAEPETPMILPRNYDYATITTTRNKRLLDAADAERHEGLLEGPVIERERLKANIDAFKAVAARLMETERFATALSNIQTFRDAFSEPAGPPVFVLSTGRCGTYALQRLMERSRGVQSHHTLAIQISAADRNHLLYRILAGELDENVLGEILAFYLETRMAEILYALRHRKSMVVVNHLDTVFAPFNSVFHPDSRFIHLHRNDEPTYRSIASKNQWGGQLQHWQFDPAFPDGRFVHKTDENLSQENHIAWFLHVTKVFSQVFLETMPKDRGISIKSEDMFSQDPGTFAELQKILPIDDISDAAFGENFSKPVNAKSGLIDRSIIDLDDRQGAFRQCLEGLQRNGAF